MSRRPLLITGCIALAAVGGVAGIQWIQGRGTETRRHAPPPSAGPIRVVLGEQSARRHDIGEVSRGGRREVPFVVSNRGPTAVTVGAIRTSCDCLRVEL